MDKSKKQYEYIIGIDLGHGETSAAICPLQWDTPSTSLLDPAKDLEMGGNKKVIPSAITILDDGTAYIGDSAFAPTILKKASVNVCFKKAPQDIDGDAEQLMIRFMREVYLLIRENNSGMLHDGNHLVYIATPSGWNHEQQNLYKKMAEKAGLPIAGVTKESRAAFVRAQQDSTSGLRKNIHKGAIVFDMGSSTLDFTYMNNEINDHMIDFGYDCGASKVEKIIYSIKREESEAIQLFESRYPKLIDYLVFQARIAKEQIFFDPSLPYKKTINFEDFVEDEELEEERFSFRFQPGQLNEILEEAGYMKLIEDAMDDFINNKIKGQPICAVFLTGGASRMNFIKDLVCKHWNVTPEQVWRDTDPSLTISQGVADLARIDLRTEGGNSSIKQKISQLENNNTIFDEFAEEYGKLVWDNVIDVINNTVRTFCEGNVDRSVDDLQIDLQRNIKNCINKKSSEVPIYLQNSINKKTADIRKEIDDMVRAYAHQGTTIKIPKFEISSLNVGNINMNAIVKEISDQITSDSTNWFSIGGMGIATILFGIPGLLISGGISYLLDKYGKSEEEKKAEARKKPLSKSNREKFGESFATKWNEGNMSQKLYNDIVKSIKNNSNIKQDIKSALKSMLEAYKQELKNARILVD